MASEAVSAHSQPLDQHSRYIRKQLRRTAMQVKLVDLFTSLMLMAGGAVAFLLLLAVVDHWIWPLGFWARLLAFAILVSGVGYGVVRIVTRLVMQQVNPLYAARTIEQSQPTLKNSLINFLMFRPAPRGMVIYEALQQQAATDLSRVDLSSVVDRGKLIRIGYLVAAMMAVCALYTILSPKSFPQSASRVVAPWAEIARPARVEIYDVQPGNDTVYQGRPAEVSAAVRGLRDGETPLLLYSTEDEQIVDQPLPMQWNSRELRYQLELPPDSDGLGQSVRYRIKAGDALSPTYRLEAIPAPTINVQRVIYDYPEYTGKSRRVVDRHADLRAVEGTRVTIEARANQVIDRAFIELDPRLNPDGASRAAQRVNMQADGRDAQGQLLLRLNEQRTAPLHDAYQLRFFTPDGERNEDPILHSIHVTADLPPEISLLEPQAAQVEVPVDGRQRIELRAIDPDFGLTRVTLRGDAGNTSVIDEPLLDEPQGRRGQVVMTYDFRPRQLELEPGDRVNVWAVAEDNRMAPGTESPQPNTARTRSIELVVTEARQRDDLPQDPAEQDADDRASQEDRAPQEPVDDPTQQPADEGEAGDDGRESSEGDQPAEQEADPSDQQNGADEAQHGADGEHGDAAQDGEGAGERAAADQADGTSGQPDDSADPAGDGSLESDARPDGEGPRGDGEGTPSGDGQANAQESSPDRTADEGETGDGSPDQGSDELHDGEVFERIQRHRERQQRQADEDRSSAETPEDGTASGEESQTAPEAAADPAVRPEDADAGEDSSGAQQAGADDNFDQERSTGQMGTDQPDSPQRGLPEEGQADRDNGTTADDSTSPPDAGTQAPDAAPQGDVPERDASGQPTGADRTDDAQPQTDEPSEQLGGTKPEAALDAGEGAESESREATPEAQQEQRERETSADDTDHRREEEAAPSSESDHESDSIGGDSGEHSGGGEKGGGQQADQPGHDQPGSGQSSDEGAGASPERGEGETGEQAGDQQPSDHSTGRGEEQGEGSQQAPGDDSTTDDGQPSGQTEDNAADESRASDGRPPDHDSTGQPGEDGQATGSPLPTGGGLPDDAQPIQPYADHELADPPGSEANLEYARQATDLALEYLEQQRENPDQQLLDELGWTDEDLQNFLQRWREMEQSAGQNEEAQRDWVDALQSLGLRPESARLREGETRSDEVRQMREDAGRTRPPSRYRDLFDAYQKGTARSADR